VIVAAQHAIDNSREEKPVQLVQGAEHMLHTVMTAYVQLLEDASASIAQITLNALRLNSEASITSLCA
jgi:hypothetical protein